MRTVTVDYTICKYDELSDDAKQEVKDWYLSDMDRCYLFEEDVKNDLKNLFGSDSDLDVQFSLGYSQGDGVNVYGTVSAQGVFDAIKSAPTQLGKYKDSLTDEQKAIILDYANEYGGITIPYNQHYCYCRASSCEWDNADYYFNTEMNDKDKLAHDFLTIVSGVFETLCKVYEDWGYDFFYKISDDDMSDICEANGWEFYEDGRMF